MHIIQGYGFCVVHFDPPIETLMPSRAYTIII